jgi:hypothetical protein
MGCAGKKCCCSGCTPVIDERAIRVGCCRCIPTGICVAINTYTNDYQKVLWRLCGQTLLNGSTELTLFTDTFQIEGEAKIVKFLLVLDDAYAECDGVGGGCSFCVEIDGVRDCLVIDHYEQHDNADTPNNPCPAKSEFCCTFAAAFELELEDIGTVSITTNAADFINRTGPGRKCAGCNCICECACIGVASLSGSSNSQVCAVNDEEGNPTWTTADGVGISLVGRGGTSLDASEIVTGTESSGVDTDVLAADRIFHILQPDEGVIDANYTFQTNTAEHSWSVSWSGYITDSEATATIYAWNWSTGYWDVLCEPQGAEQTAYGIPRTITLDEEHTGTGDDQGLIRIRVYSETATEIGIDSILFKTPDCCKLRLSATPYGSTPDEGTEPADVEIDSINSCPSPTATWSYFVDGEAVHIYFDCAFCEECAGGTLSCCPNPIPRVLTATLEIDCGVCADALEFPLVFEPGGAGWTGGPANNSCISLISIIFPDGSDIDPCLDVNLSVGGACTSVTETVVGSCDPLHVVVTGYFDECINVCNDFSTFPPIGFTLTITE